MDGRGRAYPGTPEWLLDELLTAEQGLRAVTLDAALQAGVVVAAALSEEREVGGVHRRQQ